MGFSLNFGKKIRIELERHLCFRFFSGGICRRRMIGGGSRWGFFRNGFAIGFAHVWQITLVTLAVVPLIATCGGIYAYVVIGFVSRARKSYVKAGEIADEVLRNVRIVQASVAEKKAVKSYRAALLESYNFGVKAGLAKGLGLGSLNFVLFCSFALLIWFTSTVVHKGIANGGDSFTTMLSVIISAVSLGQAAPNTSTFIQAKAAGYRIFKMIERETVSTSNSNISRTLEKVEGHINFKDVCFSYPSRPDVMVFNNLCLDVPSGKIVALVGSSGSGKSTIISLIERFYDPLSGKISLDRNDIRELDIKWLRQKIGLVNQEPALFAMSIRENILYAKSDATVEEITHATDLSGAVSFIDKLPDGYETQVGERGIQLSGGQKQRIAISRAILKNPSIVLLDEATSALDAESEKSVQEALNRAMKGRTTIIVAHRLSTIWNADVIAVVRDGRIVQTGSHEELMSEPNSVYASLAEVQEAVFSSKPHPLLDPAMGQILSSKHPEELFCSGTGFGANFLSNDKSTRQCNSGGAASIKPKPVSMKRLYAMWASDWIYGVFGTIGAIVTGAETPLWALGITEALVAYYLDWYTTARIVKKIAFFFCGGAILSIIFHTMEHLSFGTMGERLTIRVREMMFAAILRNEIGWFDDKSNSSLMLSSRLEADVTLLRKIVVDHSTILIQNASLAITSFIIAFILNWRIMLVVLATYPLLIIGNISEKLFMQGYTRNLYETYLKANMIASEALSNIHTVIAFCSEDKVLDLYARELSVPSRLFFRRGQISGIFYGVSQFFIFSSYGLILWYGSVLMGKEVASFKSVIKAFMVLVITAFAMADTLACAPYLIQGSHMLASLFGLLDRTSEVSGDVGEEVTRVEGTIEFKGIKFSYPSRPNILIFKDFSMKVCSGKRMALVGSSGSGKSSVLALILRYYDPIAGQIMIDGKDIKGLKLKSLREHIGLVQQEPSLFATSIYENILYGNDGASELEVIEAAKLCNAHTFISGLPDGYLTKVGEQGVQLSGGQKQRVAIARAVLKDPAILLLDEATSALDVESEHIVQQALDRLMKGRTTVIVAHRLSTIQNADQISVLEDGVIVEQGSHSTLLENINGAYYRLVRLQQKQQHQRA